MMLFVLGLGCKPPAIHDEVLDPARRCSWPNVGPLLEWVQWVQFHTQSCNNRLTISVTMAIVYWSYHISIYVMNTTLMQL